MDVANFRESPSIDAYILGTITRGTGFYIEDTYVDDEGDVWCYFGAYDEYNNYLTGWSVYTNFI